MLLSWKATVHPNSNVSYRPHPNIGAGRNIYFYLCAINPIHGSKIVLNWNYLLQSQMPKPHQGTAMRSSAFCEIYLNDGREKNVYLISKATKTFQLIVFPAFNVLCSTYQHVNLWPSSILTGQLSHESSCPGNPLQTCGIKEKNIFSVYEVASLADSNAQILGTW